MGSLSVSRAASTAMFLLIKLLLAAPAYSLPSNAIYTDNDYVDIDEGALVKVEFSKTLSGMMSAMEEIQARADNIMENIMMKEVELAEIEERAELAEEERLSLEHHSNQ